MWRWQGAEEGSGTGAQMVVTRTCWMGGAREGRTSGGSCDKPHAIHHTRPRTGAAQPASHLQRRVGEVHGVEGDAGGGEQRAALHLRRHRMEQGWGSVMSWASVARAEEGRVECTAAHIAAPPHTTTLLRSGLLASSPLPQGCTRKAAGRQAAAPRPQPAPPLACGCMVMRDSTMHSTNERVMREMLREQSAPPGANQWYSRPAMVMQPAGLRRPGGGCRLRLAAARPKPRTASDAHELLRAATSAAGEQQQEQQREPNQRCAAAAEAAAVDHLRMRPA